MATETTNLSLTKPAIGETGWGAAVNTNADTIDTQINARASIVSGGTENNFFSLDANGDLQDSGYAAGDFTALEDHASRHITGGADEVDGDKLDIDWNPTYSTPATTPTEATSVDHLTAHLYGIDRGKVPIDGTLDMAFVDAQADAWSWKESTNTYLKVITSNSAEAIQFGVDFQLEDNVLRFGETSKPTNVANKIFLYAKDDSGDTELFANDDSNNEVQFTKDGLVGRIGQTEWKNFVIDGGGSAITTGIKGDIVLPACTIVAVQLLADQSTTTVVDIWKDTYANFPPTDADSITASAVPATSAATKSEDTTLTGWTTAVAEGDILRFNVDSTDNATRVTVALKITYL